MKSRFLLQLQFAPNFIAPLKRRAPQHSLARRFELRYNTRRRVLRNVSVRRGGRVRRCCWRC